MSHEKVLLNRLQENCVHFFLVGYKTAYLAMVLPLFSPTDGTIHVCDQSIKIRKGDGLQLLGVNALAPIVP